MITVASFDNTEQAELLKDRLDQEGIPAFVADGAIVGLNWMYSNAVGGVKVQVNEENVARVRAMLKALAIPIGGPEPLSPYLCPHCGSAKVVFRRVSVAFLMVSLLALGFPLAFYHPRCQCLDCGKKWKRNATTTGPAHPTS